MAPKRLRHNRIRARLRSRGEVSLCGNRSGFIAKAWEVTAPADGENSGSWKMCSDFLDDLNAITLRHNDIYNNYIDRTLEKIANSDGTVVRCCDGESYATQHLLNGVAYIRFVVDH